MTSRQIATYMGRQFLKTLEGGCTAPIGALARYNEEEDTIHFQGVLFSLEKKKLKLIKLFLSKNGRNGFYAAQGFK
jgi:hydroxymethylbilane synthase